MDLRHGFVGLRYSIDNGSTTGSGSVDFIHHNSLINDLMVSPGNISSMLEENHYGRYVVDLSIDWSNKNQKTCPHSKLDIDNPWFMLCHAKNEWISAQSEGIDRTKETISQFFWDDYDKSKINKITHKF